MELSAHLFGGFLGASQDSTRKHQHAVCLYSLSAIIVLTVLNNIIWLRIETRPPRWDEAVYLSLSLKYYDALVTGGIGAFLKALLTFDPLRPPLVPALAVPMYVLFGRSADVALATNLVASVVALLAVYRVGTSLVSCRVGVLAAFFAATYEGMYALSRVFHLEYWTATFVVLCLYFLARTENFTKLGAAFALGDVLGFGLLCRAFSPIFLVGPVVVNMIALWNEWREGVALDERRLSVRIKCLGWAALSCGLVAGPWCAWNIIPLTFRSFSAAYGALAIGYGPENPWALFSLLNYFLNFTNFQPTLLGLLIFLAALCVVIWKRDGTLSDVSMVKPRRRFGFVFLLSAVCVPYLFSLRCPRKTTRI